MAFIELVSPGNKNSRHALRSFIEKTLDLVRHGVNILIGNIFSPSMRDPHGIHTRSYSERADH